MNLERWRRLQIGAPHEHEHKPTRIEFGLALLIGLALTASLFSERYFPIPGFVTPLLLGLFLGVKIVHIVKKGGTLLEDYTAIAVIGIFFILYFVLKADLSPILITVFILILFYSAGLMLWVKTTFGSPHITHFIASYILTTLMIIFLFSGAYVSRASNFIERGEEVQLSFEQALYFSTVTFTTVGYGDITPVGINQALAGIEAYLGMLINIALLGYVLSTNKGRNGSS